MPDQDKIRERAYAIWEQDGRPEGREQEHWYRASSELGGDGASMDLDSGAITPDGRPATAPADSDRIAEQSTASMAAAR